jgi:hypothetical protein
VGLAAEVRAEEITASFENGVLSVMVPRAKKAQPKRIPVTMAEAEQPRIIRRSPGVPRTAPLAPSGLGRMGGVKTAD